MAKLSRPLCLEAWRGRLRGRLTDFCTHWKSLTTIDDESHEVGFQWIVRIVGEDLEFVKPLGRWEHPTRHCVDRNRISQGCARLASNRGNLKRVVSMTSVQYLNYSLVTCSHAVSERTTREPQEGALWIGDKKQNLSKSRNPHSADAIFHDCDFMSGSSKKTLICYLCAELWCDFTTP